MRSIAWILWMLCFAQGFAFATPMSLGVWSEWTPYRQMIEDLPTLKARNLRLHLAVHLPEEQDLSELLRQANQLQVEVWLWPLLPRDRGYWLNQWNSEEYTQSVRTLVTRLLDAGVNVSGVSMDLEPPPEMLEKLLKSASKLRFGELKRQARQNQDPGLFQSSKERIRELADWLHSRGLQTHLVTTSLLLTEESDDSLEQALGIPVVPEAFDHLSFMSYRSEFERMLGRMNSRVVYEHALRAKARYGEKASMDVGVVGDIEFPHPVRGYRRPKRLLQDLGALQAAGISRAQIYCWEGLRGEEWNSLDPKSKKPLFSMKFSLLDHLISWLDRSIDFPDSEP